MPASSSEKYDVAIVGGGPAGIAAACRARESGKRVVMIDEGVGPGGQIWRPNVIGAPHRAAQPWLARLDASGATIYRSTSVFDARRTAGGSFVVSAEQVTGALEIECGALILATGARERFVPFPGWTLPNVVGIGGAQALLKSGLLVDGRRVVIAGSGPLLLPVAASMARAGAKIALVAEQASPVKVRRFAMGLWRNPATLLQAASLRAAFLRTAYRTGTWVVSASGDDAVRSVTMTDGRTTREWECDLLCVGFGLVPNIQLARLLGCETGAGTVLVDATQATNVPNLYCAGEPTGIGGVDLSLVEGEIAGLAASGGVVPQRLIQRRTALSHHAAQLDVAFALRPELRGLARPDTIVCRCEDVRLRDLDDRWTVRQAKLYTRAGMGPCQGRICGTALESLMGWTADSVRPPVQPARLGSLLHESTATKLDSIGVR